MESDGRDEVNFPGTTFHFMILLRKGPPDEDIAKKVFAILDSNNSSNIQPIQANIVGSEVASE